MELIVWTMIGMAVMTVIFGSAVLVVWLLEKTDCTIPTLFMICSFLLGLLMRAIYIGGK